MKLSTKRLLLAGVLLLASCARLPNGPSVMVLPGRGKDFAQFSNDDGVCRQWATQQTGTTTKQAANNAAVGDAAVGTVLGAASGAAIGAAAGAPGIGAAVGSGVGLLGGTAVGADDAYATESIVQHRYDVAYMQCMYANGNQIPVPRGVQFQPARVPPSHPSGSAADAPPPPPGRPPPPPPR